MKTFSMKIGNGWSYEDYDSEIVIVAADNEDEARELIDFKAPEFRHYREIEYVSEERELFNDKDEAVIITRLG